MGHDAVYNGKITYYFTKEMDAEYCCKALVLIFQPTRENILEDSNLHSTR
jgi:hypothetical protein